MKFPRLLVGVLLASPAFAVSKEIQELQRDMAQLQDQVRQLKESQDRQLAALQVLVQQAVDNASRANTSAAVIQSSVQQSLKDQESKVVTPVVGLAARMDALSNDMRTVQQAVSDLTSMLSKLQAQLTDLGNAVKVMQAPPPPPPTQTSALSVGSSSSPDVPPMSANDLYNHASADRSSGKLDLALQEFSDYLKWYGNTDLAPNAQFYIAFIHYSQGDYERAANEFDMVLEKFSKNSKTEDAMYYKGESLLRLPGRKTQAADEFLELIKENPNSDYARKACSELQSLGRNCGPPRTGISKSAKKGGRN
jgi:TolA-binding protein